LSGAGWPAMTGTWAVSGSEVTLTNTAGPKDCLNPARYGFATDGPRVRFTLVVDECKPRGMILHGSEWLPRGVAAPIPVRRIVRTAGTAKGAPPAPAGGAA